MAGPITERQSSPTAPQPAPAGLDRSECGFRDGPAGGWLTGSDPRRASLCGEWGAGPVGSIPESRPPSTLFGALVGGEAELHGAGQVAAVAVGRQLVAPQVPAR